MAEIKIALLQLRALGADQAANLEKGTAACRQAAALGADVALFPEMWNIGYTFFDRSQPGAQEAWAAQAVANDGPFVQHFQALAAELGLAIAVTYLEQTPGRPRNTVALLDRHGRLALRYAKVHTCEWDAEAALEPGDGFYVCALDTAAGEVQVGAMICFDREFPESARLLMLQGAEIILVPNACEMEANRRGQLRTRAYENMTGVALANYASEGGHSVAYTAVAFGEQGQSLDPLIVEAGVAEGVYLAAFDLDSLRRWRQREVWGNAYRRPRLYRALADSTVAEPFRRPDATR